MEKTFSPKQVARALNVSESSLKRWCDQGQIGTMRTVGGHRRIKLSDVITFVRQTERQLSHPELLGLPAITQTGNRVASRAHDTFLDALDRGDEVACRRLVLELFLAGRRLDDLCDNLIAKSMNQIGDQWECGELEVYQERFAGRICQLVLDECRSCLPSPPPDAPFAIGCSPETDPYSLATQMVELVLIEAGWTAMSLGSNVPLRSLRAAISEKRPKLVWLSVSYVDDLEQFLRDYSAFQKSMPDDVPLVVGGKLLNETVRKRMTFFAHCDTLTQLRNLTAKLNTRLRRR